MKNADQVKVCNGRSKTIEALERNREVAWARIERTMDQGIEERLLDKEKR